MCGQEHSVTLCPCQDRLVVYLSATSQARSTCALVPATAAAPGHTWPADACCVPDRRPGAPAVQTGAHRARLPPGPAAGCDCDAQGHDRPLDSRGASGGGPHRSAVQGTLGQRARPGHQTRAIHQSGGHAPAQACQAAGNGGLGMHVGLHLCKRWDLVFMFPLHPDLALLPTLQRCLC